MARARARKRERERARERERQTEGVRSHPPAFRHRRRRSIRRRLQRASVMRQKPNLTEVQKSATTAQTPDYARLAALHSPAAASWWLRLLNGLQIERRLRHDHQSLRSRLQMIYSQQRVILPVSRSCTLRLSPKAVSGACTLGLKRRSFTFACVVLKRAPSPAWLAPTKRGTIL